MGVPKLFHTLIEQYHHNEATNPTGYYIIKQKIDNNLPTHFYLDFNGGIYQCIKPEIKTEETLILHVVEYLETICKCISNLELIYIALDGVPVGGKIKNQRERRFHSICRSNRARKINATFGTETDKSNINNDIDTNMITPGTSFMYNLSIAIKRRIAEGGTNGIFNGKKVIFSDASIPGEGEHKLIHHIRDTISGKIEPHNTVIYALDGDLIFLSLSLKLDNVYLFREANDYGKLSTIHSGRKYLYMDIMELREAIIRQFKENYGCGKIETTEAKQRYIDDYIFLGMLLGNDFMPKTHWFSIGENGYDRLLSAYWQIHNHTEMFLVNTKTLQINTEMLCDLIYIVKEQEPEAVISLFEKRKRAKIPVKHDMSERERQQILVDFYPLQHLYVEQAIEPRRDGWRDNYYQICFHMKPSDENIKMVCRSYLKTLVWNFHYYFGECVSWDWVYNFSYAPTWNDIYIELVLHKNINVSNVANSLFHFKNSKPVEAQTLLFMVLPWQSKKFMANDISRKLNEEKCPMRIYFPKRYGLNVAFHRYYHECTPIIYNMEYNKVVKFIKECKFTEDEILRNIAGNLFIKE